MTRVLIAKPGLDGHDRGATSLAYALRDRGFEVIYSGLRQEPEKITVMALQEDIDVIGLSFLSGSHLSKVREIVESMEDAGISDVPILVGGIIPDRDVEKLEAMDVKGVFGPESSVDEIAAAIEAHAPSTATAGTAEESDQPATAGRSTGTDGEQTDDREREETREPHEIVSGGPDQSVFGTPIQKVYDADDFEDFSPETQLGNPGEFPFTRGIRPGMYRDELWVMGMYSGHGTPEETNERLKELIDSGETGFSLALDLPTQLGLDADDPRASGEVGRTGTPISSQHDLETVFEDIPLDEMKQIRTTANAIGPIFVAFLVGAAREHGYEPEDFKVLLQNDSLKEYIARGTHIFPPEAGIKLSVDVMEYVSEEIPHWEPIEFCSYHLRDAGMDPSEAVGVTFGNAFEYLDAAVERDLAVEEVVRNVYVFMSSVGNREFFEEIAKFRASRRAWARLLTDRYDVTDEDALKLNIFTWGGVGSTLTKAEPKNNIVRTAYGSLAAVLGGVQTLAVHGYDEALGLPTEDAARVALRTQQILAHETGVTKTVDPLAGSYFIENLTDDFEEALYEELERLETHGGTLEMIKDGQLKREFASTGYEALQKVESGEQPVVGVNIFESSDGDEEELKAFEIDEEVESHQHERLERLRERRDDDAVEEALAEVKRAAENDENTVPALLEASNAYATIGEIVEVLKEVYGTNDPRTI